MSVLRRFAYTKILAFSLALLVLSSCGGGGSGDGGGGTTGSGLPDLAITSFSAPSAGVAGNDLNRAYAEVRSVDFSREVLAALPHRLLVVKDGASGWTDLGTPARVIDTLVRNGIQATWFGCTTGRKAAAPQRASVDRSGDAIECS